MAFTLLRKILGKCYFGKYLKFNDFWKLRKIWKILEETIKYLYSVQS